MYANDGFAPHMNQYAYRSNPYPLSPIHMPYYYGCPSYAMHPSRSYREQPVRGQATWTEGGKVTKCGIPWSDQKYMTVAVGDTAPYKCGETLRIRNLSMPGGREIVVKVVDQVEGYPANKVNLHRRAFEALGAPLDLGVIDVEIVPTNMSDQDRWEDLLLTTAQTMYPNYRVIDYRSIGNQQFFTPHVEETYEFILESESNQLSVRGKIMYNPETEQLFSLELTANE
ncbi:MAG TPA: DUF3889 domain-containing protein [Bacillota bacterium]|nr:DUF3889 domain-containing protein [Bacillota bacterium]